VLVNLTNNAVKFTSRASSRSRSASPPTRGPTPGTFLLDFSVSDTGIGIPPDRFGCSSSPQPGRLTTTRKYGGTGLGLAISHRLCEMMGGSIDVTSSPDQGSRFSLLHRDIVVDLPDFQTPPFPHARPRPVLAVDDHPVNRAMLEQCLRQWSCNPGSPARPRGPGHRPRTKLTAAIIDQDLGGTSGIDLIAPVRAIWPGLPIVVLAPATAARNGREPRRPRLPPAQAHQALPAHDALRRVLAEAAAQAGPPQLRRRRPRLADSLPLDILLVEDNPVNTKVALSYLNRLGLQGHDRRQRRRSRRRLQQRKFTSRLHGPADARDGWSHRHARDPALLPKESQPSSSRSCQRHARRPRAMPRGPA